MSLVLASASPRRRELLSRLGLEFKIVTSGVEENGSTASTPEVYAQDWAERKARAVVDLLGKAEDHWYLGVDTIVVVNDRILGKPTSVDNAKELLGLISGRWHQVVSGYCILHPPRSRKILSFVRSEVKIKALEPDEIMAYAAIDEPHDKAGAYAVQGVGAFMVEEIRGSYTNVMGLPLTEVVSDLRRLGVIETVVGG